MISAVDAEAIFQAWVLFERAAPEAKIGTLPLSVKLSELPFATITGREWKLTVAVFPEITGLTRLEPSKMVKSWKDGTV
jgi:hypothetical protein